jgi:ribosome-binding protein aMBF1 (putative translation factor)
VRNYIAGLPRLERDHWDEALTLLAHFGLEAPVSLRQLEGKLWEIRVGRHRVAYVVLSGAVMVLLHAFRKQGQRTPRTDFDLANATRAGGSRRFSMKKTKRTNPHIGSDALADVRARTERDPRLRARIDSAVARATVAVMVKRARTAAGLTQAQLATRAATTQAVIARIESGTAFTASLDLLDRIARALGGRVTVEFEGIRTRAA